MDLKKCTTCGIERLRSEFFKSGKHPSGKDKFRGDCKSCASKNTNVWRNYNREKYNNYAAEWRAKNPEKQHATEIKRHYGLSKEDYNKMLTSQNMRCKICQKKHEPSIKRGKLYVDHNHSTGAIRGLLCGGCNSAIGHMNDDIELLKAAIDYLSA